MAVFAATLVLFLVAVGAMAIGLVRGRRLSGSCGGVDRLGQPIGDCHCGKAPTERCSLPGADLRNEQAASANAN